MSRHPRVRVENCVVTILELNRYLENGQIRRKIIQQFQKLKEFLQNISKETTSEIEIRRIEDATSQLLNEISDSLQKYGIDYHHKGPVN